MTIYGQGKKKNSCDTRGALVGIFFFLHLFHLPLIVHIVVVVVVVENKLLNKVKIPTRAPLSLFTHTHTHTQLARIKKKKICIESALHQISICSDHGHAHASLSDQAVRE